MEDYKKPKYFGFIALGIIGALLIFIFSNKENIKSFLNRVSSYSPSQNNYKSPPASPESHFELKVNKFETGAYNNYEVVGEIKNIDTRSFRFVEIKAVFRNQNGDAVGEDTTYACGTDFILPGASKSFKFLGDSKPDYKRVVCSVKDCMEVR
jgi:hypothetical protein